MEANLFEVRLYVHVYVHGGGLGLGGSPQLQLSSARRICNGSRAGGLVLTDTFGNLARI
jgi:hypothetical protein